VPRAPDILIVTPLGISHLCRIPGCHRLLAAEILQPKLANREGLKLHPTAAEEADLMNLFKTELLKSPCVVVIALILILSACQQKQSPQELREKTAQATAEAKSDAKAVADGIREGWNRNQPLDLNSASKEQLLSLPGMTSEGADRVIAGRPYSEPGDLVTRHIVSRAEYDKIADRVTAKK